LSTISSLFGRRRDSSNAEKSLKEEYGCKAAKQWWQRGFRYDNKKSKKAAAMTLEI
jgi:hypothetical protein